MSSVSDKIIEFSRDESVSEALSEFVRSQPGRRLPGERELASRFGISRPRLRAILREMQAAGLIESRQGSGTYAIDPNQPGLKTTSILVDEEIKLGEDPFFSHMFDRLQRACQKNGLRCQFRRIGQSATPHEALCDGAIVVGAAGRRIVTDHGASGRPVVALVTGASSRPTRRVSVVQLDDRSAGEAAARQLADRGCRRIVFVGRLDIDSSRDRFAGIQAVCEAAKLELRAVESHLNYQAGLEAGRRLADEEPADTGLIAMNDWLALGLRGGLDARGAHPVYPLVSFDGLDVAANPHLNIVSLRVPVELIASDTVAELRRLHGSPTSSGRTLTYELESPAYSPSLSI